MHGRTVIAFVIVLEDKLPIGLHIVGYELSRLEERKIPAIELIEERRKDLLEPFRRSCKVKEDKAFPNLQIDRVQRVFFFVEVFDLLH